MIRQGRLFLLASVGIIAAAQAAASTSPDCTALGDRLAVSTCLINAEIARLEAETTATAASSGNATALSGGADAASLATGAGTEIGVAGATFPGARLTVAQRRAILQSRRQLIEVAKYPAAQYSLGFAQDRVLDETLLVDDRGVPFLRDDRRFLFLLPLLLLLAILAGGGDGEPISPS